MSSHVEQQYHSRIDSLWPKERVARCAAMLKWTRDWLARQVIDEVLNELDEIVCPMARLFSGQTTA